MKNTISFQEISKKHKLHLRSLRKLIQHYEIEVKQVMLEGRYQNIISLEDYQKLKTHNFFINSVEEIKSWEIPSFKINEILLIDSSNLSQHLKRVGITTLTRWIKDKTRPVKVITSKNFKSLANHRLNNADLDNRKEIIENLEREGYIIDQYVGDYFVR